jgi:hypothetical protein
MSIEKPIAGVPPPAPPPSFTADLATICASDQRCPACCHDVVISCEAITHINRKSVDLLRLELCKPTGEQPFGLRNSVDLIAPEPPINARPNHLKISTA